MSRTDKLSQLYKKAHSLNEDLPKELIDKLSIYGQILELVGGMHADSLGEWKLAEAHRKEAIATVYSLDPEGSNKDRENKAEMGAAKLRRDEALAEREATRWKNAYNSTLEQIQIMKKRYEHLVNVFNKGGI